jgi:lysophospholipase L1-like esterase
MKRSHAALLTLLAAGALAFVFLRQGFEFPWSTGLTDINRDGRIDVICFGDSLTAGGMQGAYPADLRGRLPEGTNVVNLGRFGEVTTHGRLRLGEALEEQRADYVIILEGVNDHCDDPDATFTNLHAMAINVRDKGAVPLVGTLFVSPKKTGEDKQRCYEALNARILQMPGVVPVDFAATIHNRWDELLLRGGVHPNSAGDVVLAETALAALREASRRGRSLLAK